MRLGVHVPLADPVGWARAAGAEVVQVRLSPARQWRAPRARPDADRWRSWDIAIYVHAPYVCNPASGDAVVRRRTARCLREQADAAADIGACGLVVHSGSATSGGGLEAAVAGWCEVLGRHPLPVPVILENPAGGGTQVAAAPADAGALIGALRASVDPASVGWCLDTCHAWAAGWFPVDWLEAASSVLGPPALLHINDARAARGSRLDRHQRLGRGRIGLSALVAVVARAAQAGCPAGVLEVPGGLAAMVGDLDRLRGALGRAGAAA